MEQTCLVTFAIKCTLNVGSSVHERSLEVSMPNSLIASEMTKSSTNMEVLK